MPPLTTQLLGEETPHEAQIVTPVAAPYQFLHVNGCVYRCNTITGEMWRLMPSAQDRKAQVWTLIEESQGTH